MTAHDKFLTKLDDGVMAAGEESGLPLIEGVDIILHYAVELHAHVRGVDATAELLMAAGEKGFQGLLGEWDHPSFTSGRFDA
jgi:hypothetical protein